MPRDLNQSTSPALSNGRMRLAALALLSLVLFGLIQPTGSAEAATNYRISFMANGGTGVMSSQVIPSTGGNLKKNTFTRVGYAFLGWAKTTQGALAFRNSARVKPTSSFKLYAKWSKLPVVLPTAPTVSGHTVGSLLWAEEFKGAAGGLIDSKTWTARFCGHEAENGGGTCHNAEPQWYIPDAIRLDGSADGNAVITTTRTTVEPAGATCMVGQCYFTSGRFDTQGKVSFKYGYIETESKCQPVAQTGRPIGCWATR